MRDISNDKLLVIENLEVRYGNSQVLWGVSLSAAKGGVTCIIGSNGAGKTTTLNAIAGALPAQSGRIHFDGVDITRLSARDRIELRISLVPEGRQLWPGMSVEENLLMGCYLPSLRAKAQQNLSRIYEMFPRLKQRRRQLAGTLSGGEQQMCAIGRGLISDPHLLLLDEPSLGLAPKMVQEIFHFIGDIAREGVTILLVGQNVNYTLQVSQYGYVMELGRISLEGQTEMLLGSNEVRRAYLGITEDEP